MMSRGSVVLLFFVCVVDASFKYSTHTNYDPTPNWPNSCSAAADGVYLLSRHGSREPSSKVLASANALISRISKEKEKIKLDWLKSWENPFNDPKDLARRGVQEVYDAGSRLFTRLGALEETEVDSRSTHVRRAARTGVAFTESLFKEYYSGDLNPAPYVYMEPQNQDYLLRFFKLCPPYVQAVSSPAVLEEQEKFGAIIFPGMAAKLAEATGMSDLQNSDVLVFWNLCAFEDSLFNETSHFCSLFGQDDVDALNYYEDLKYWWERGYGLKVTAGIASSLLNETMYWADKKTSAPYMLRFAHAETVMPFFVILGLYKDVFVLRHDTPRQTRESRMWKTSDICPFQANIALYRTLCNGTESIVIQVNERTVAVETKKDFVSKFRSRVQPDFCVSAAPPQSSGEVCTFCIVAGSVVAFLLILFIVTIFCATRKPREQGFKFTKLLSSTVHDD